MYLHQLTRFQSAFIDWKLQQTIGVEQCEN
jgi:hypothetical protein